MAFELIRKRLNYMALEYRQRISSSMKGSQDRAKKEDSLVYEEHPSFSSRVLKRFTDRVSADMSPMVAHDKTIDELKGTLVECIVFV